MKLQALRANDGFQQPWRGVVSRAQGAAGAGAGAVTAESAFPAAEIDRRVTAITLHEDAGRAGLQAVVAARAGVDKGLFRARPGRTVFNPWSRPAAKKSAPTGIDHA